MKTIKPPYWKQINHLHPLARGLGGCWLFNEGIGDKLNDLSGNGNYGIINGAEWIPGKDGHALSFNGSSDYVNCGNASPLALTESYTLVGRFNTDIDRAGNQFILGRFTDGAYRGYAFRILTDEKLQYIHRVQGASEGGTLGNLITSRSTYNDGNWHFVAGVFAVGVGSKMFIDGLLVGADTTRTDAIPSYTNSGRLFVGAQDAIFKRHFEGIIDSAYIYNRALSAEEIKWLYREPYVMTRF